MGRFGLGLKTASFSQCKKLTVASKKNGVLSIKQWDLDFISKENKWILVTADLASYQTLPSFQNFLKYENGTIVIWEDLDRLKGVDFSDLIDSLGKHLSLVFHRFLEQMGSKQLTTFN